MSFELVLSFFVFSMVAALTPGPNNMMLANSGGTFGFKRTVPHCVGITFGYMSLLIGLTLGLGYIFQQSDLMRQIMQLVSIGLLLWITYKIWTSGSISFGKKEPRPFTFLEAAVFQWVNPKGWAVGIALVSQFVTPENKWASILMIIGVVLCTGFTSTFVWSGLGQILKIWLEKPNRLRWFNRTMALLILATLGAIIFGGK